MHCRLAARSSFSDAARVLRAFLAAIGLLLDGGAFAADVIIVADEFPAMEVLAAKLKTAENLETTIVAQTNLPPQLSSFRAVVVYIHGNLEPRVEQALIDYTQTGGRLLVLHHSISSGKRKNAQWFKFLGVELPEGDVSQGGYKWIESVTLDIVNLAPTHFITTNQVRYPIRLDYASAETAAATSLPAFRLEGTEVYLNHSFTEPRTVLLGFKYTDAKSGKVYQQDRGGWLKPAGNGWIIYLMAGHSVKDFQNAAYAQIVLNAVVWKP
jgi:hypothetical protein